MNTLRVLIADRDPHMRAFLERALAGYKARIPGRRGSFGFTTEYVTLDNEALQKLALDPPDVLVLEYWTPKLHGAELLRILQSLEIPTVAIVVAARASIPAAVEATQLGAFDFLAKPVSEQRFRETLGRALACTTLQIPTAAPRHKRVGRLRRTLNTLTRVPAAFAQFATTAFT